MSRGIPQEDVLALVHSEEYAGWVFDPDQPTQGNRPRVEGRLPSDVAGRA